MLCKLQSNDHKQKLGLKIEGCLLSASYLIWPTNSNVIASHNMQLYAITFINKRSQQLTSASLDQRESRLKLNEEIKDNVKQMVSELSRSRNLRNGYHLRQWVRHVWSRIVMICENCSLFCWYDLTTHMRHHSDKQQEWKLGH